MKRKKNKTNQKVIFCNIKKKINWHLWQITRAKDQFRISTTCSGLISNFLYKHKDNSKQRPHINKIHNFEVPRVVVVHRFDWIHKTSINSKDRLYFLFDILFQSYQWNTGAYKKMFLKRGKRRGPSQQQRTNIIFALSRINKIHFLLNSCKKVNICFSTTNSSSLFLSIHKELYFLELIKAETYTQN